LLETGHHVRALVRNWMPGPDSLRDLGAEIVVADMLDINRCAAAMQGCSVVYFTMSISSNFLEAATTVASLQEPRVRPSSSVTDDLVADERDGDHKQSANEAGVAREQMLRWSGCRCLPAVRPLFDGMFW